ncbi:MAG: signal peptidase [Actinomycetota bacterium]|nr:signal peptidase [Actinomycetota bacterium]
MAIRSPQAPDRSAEELFAEVSFRRAFPKEPVLVPKHKPFWRELPVLVVIAFAVALLLKSFVLQAFYIPSASMEETLQIGDRVLVEKMSYRIGGPSHGDVVVFEKDLNPAVILPNESDSVFEKIGDAFKGLFGFPTGDSQDYIKRVIGVAGDTVEGRNGRVFVNGKPIEEPYLQEGVQTSSFGPVDIPEGQIFVMGDNRTNSADSREFGPVAIDTIVGRAFLLIWPPTDFDTL